MINTQLILDLQHPVHPCAGDTPVTLKYDPPTGLGANPLQGFDGSDVDPFTRDLPNNRASECVDGWVRGMLQGSVIIRANRPFATNRGEPKPEWFTVSVSGGPVTVTGAAFSPDDSHVLKLELSREFAAGEAVTASYRRPQGESGLWNVDGKQLADVVNWPVTVRAREPALSVADASGAEGGSLAFAVTLDAASTSNVTVDYATADGSAAAAQDYTAVSGTLTFAAGETAKTVEVWTLTDSAAESDETLTLALSNASGASIADSEATGTVTDVPPPLTALFHGLPQSHDGSRLFTFEIRFSEEFDGLRLTALEAGGLVVTGGRIVDTKRTVRGQNRSVTVRVRPSSSDDLTLTLAAPADCTATGAICGREGRKLSASVSATVPGPATPEAPAASLPVLAISDARADEGGTLAFAVSLSQAATGIVTVDYATADGTATAGTDYTAASGTLTFAAGETEKTALVATLADRTLDDGETLTLTLSGVSGATLGTAAATGTIADVPPLPSVGVADARADEGDELEFAVTLSEATTVAVTVDYATSDGTASAGSDYVAASGSLRFAPGETSKSVAVNALTDGAVEDDETLTLTLSNPSGATLGSASATGTLVDVLPPLTASFEGMPAEHDGRRLFRFVLAFSDNFPGRFPYTTLRDSAFTVTNGRVRSAERVVKGENRRWRIGVRPASNDDVTITLAAGAVSTESGRPLANTVTATVRGPALLSVTDAEGTEGEDAGIDFAVILSRAASAPVTVNYATADETATAGEDYTAVSGTLAFAVGVTSMTVSVPLLDDVLDDGGETFVLRLSNPQGAAIQDGEGRATIRNSDPMPRAWTARFGRTVAVHVLDAVEARLDEASGSWVQVGGQRLGGPDVHETVRHLAPERSLWEEPEDPAGRTLAFRELLVGSAFHLVSNEEDQVTGPRLSAWGRVATSGFDGQEEKVTLDGTVTTATLGVDGAWKRWLSGLVFAYSEGDGSFSHLDMAGGDLESSLASVHPYVAYRLSDRVRLWGMVGYGSGDLQLRLQDRSMDTDLSMTMGALGMRGSLLDPSRVGGLELAVRSDVLWMGMDSAAAQGLAETQADASRLRLVLEGSRPIALAGGGSFTPSLEVGLRHDAGDAETGSGLEVGGSLVYASAWGLSIEASVRGLLAHEDADYEEWGASGALRYDPGRKGRGFTASIAPAWGQTAGGASSLWSQPAAAGLPGTDPLAPAAAGRLDAELGYGMAALQGRGLLTPYARVGLTEGANQAWHLGTRLAVAESLNLSLEAGRRAREGEAAAHEIALLATLGW